MKTVALPIITVFALLPGCTCSGPTTGEAPEVVVCLEDCPTSTAAGVEWSRVRNGTTEPRTLVVWNRGTATLSVSRLAIRDESSEFAISYDVDGACGEDGFDLPSDGECNIVVTYTPMDAVADENALVVESNDPRDPSKEVRLFSSEIGPSLVIEPAIIDFGLIENRTGPVVARVINDGTDPADVGSVTRDGSTEFSITDDRCGAPVTLQPGESCEVDVRYDLDVGGSGEGTLVADATAEGVADGRATLAGPPVAACEQDMSDKPGVATEIDGTPSRAPGGSICRYEWTVEGPAGSANAAAFNAGEAIMGKEGESCPSGQNTLAEPCFIADTPGEYRFSLRVVDCRTNCTLSDRGNPCDDAARCCSFDCTGGTCGEGGETSVCADAGGCEIASELAACPLLVVPDESLFVSLSWDGPGDMDIHMVRCSGEDPGWQRAPDAVYWANPTEDWCEERVNNGVECKNNAACAGMTTGTNDYGWCLKSPEFIAWCADNPDCAGCTTVMPIACSSAPTENVCTDATDDPFLQIDDCDGFGPETMVSELPCGDTYAVAVDYFGGACGPGGGDADTRSATLHLYVLGQELCGSPVTATLEPQDFWYVGRIIVPEGLSGACLETEPLVSGVNPAPDPVIPTLPSPCGAGPYACPNPCDDCCDRCATACPDICPACG